MPRNLFFVDDGSSNDSFIFQNPIPMPHELTAIFGRIRRQSNRVAVELLLEEDFEIGSKDGAEDDFGQGIIRCELSVVYPALEEVISGAAGGENSRTGDEMAMNHLCWIDQRGLALRAV